MVTAQSPVLAGALVLFIIMAAYTVLNMLIGIMCETIRVVAECEKEENTVTYLKDQLLHMLETSGLDENGDRMIARSEFTKLLEIKPAAKALHHLGVDVPGLLEMEDFIFEASPRLDFSEFMEVVLSLRGSNVATVKDIVDLRHVLRVEQAKIYRLIEAMESEEAKSKRLKARFANRGTISATDRSSHGGAVADS
eukprot:TRINITY_DN37452_c0_g1_i2.p1 TRINITY_DN37452_c0_g1~~TRINITY_DN37452_c0_g1_i2.p1  ORF type:complete len:213 (-),score=47.79 TRINITY_DN37452_c0_g1_i2:133-717(-)